MPRVSSADHPFDILIQRAAEILAERLSGLGASAGTPARRGPGRPPGSKNAASRRSSALKGKKLDMGCRVAGCKNRSGGPRWGFICEEHRAKLGKKQLQAARDAWKAAHPA